MRLRRRPAARRGTTFPTERIRRRLRGGRRRRCIIIGRRDRPGRPDRRPATSRRRARSTGPFDVSLLRGRSTRGDPGRPIAPKRVDALPSTRTSGGRLEGLDDAIRSRSMIKTSGKHLQRIRDRDLRDPCDLFNSRLIIEPIAQLDGYSRPRRALLSDQP